MPLAWLLWPLLLLFYPFAGVALHIFILPGYALSILAMVALFCMVLATDPVTVALPSSIDCHFQNQKKPSLRSAQTSIEALNIDHLVHFLS